MSYLRTEYRFLAPQIVSASYREVSVDVRGHGETSGLWPDYSVDAVGSDLIALIRCLNARPAVIMGTLIAAGASVGGCGSAGTGDRPYTGRSLCARQDSLAYDASLFHALRPAAGTSYVAALLFESVSCQQAGRFYPVLRCTAH